MKDLVIGAIDGDTFKMEGSKQFYRRKPVKAVRMAKPFIVTTNRHPERFEVGDILLEQDGVRWGIPGDMFDTLYAPIAPRW